jgi:hypothetical protein
MDLQTIRTNLQRTIVGKEALLIQYQHQRQVLPSRGGDAMALVATIRFLETNLVELRAILKDVDQAIADQSGQV